MLISLGVAAVGCGSGASRGAWVDEQKLDRDTWGEHCGDRRKQFRSETDRGGLVVHSWDWTPTIDFSIPRTEPHLSCELRWRERDRSLWRLRVHAYGNAEQLTRADIDKLLGDMFLPYLPPDVQLVARDVAYHQLGPGEFEVRRSVKGFRIVGGTKPGSAWALSIESGPR
jgi:hypothetical protein